MSSMSFDPCRRPAWRTARHVRSSISTRSRLAVDINGPSPLILGAYTPMFASAPDDETKRVLLALRTSYDVKAFHRQGGTYVPQENTWRIGVRRNDCSMRIGLDGGRFGRI